MTGLAQAAAGAALAIGLAMLWTRQIGVTFVLFAAQSAVVAGAAVLTGQPLLAAGTVAIPVAIRMARPAGTQLAAAKSVAAIADSSTSSTLAGATLALLCLSMGETGLSLAVLLLAAVLAAARPEPVARLIAVGAMANGIALTGCLVAEDALLPLACLVLPLPLLVGLVEPPLGASLRWMREATARAGWAEFGAAAALFVAALTVPLDALASVFAPLIAFDGTVRAWLVRRHDARAPAERLAAPLKLGCMLLAICTGDPVLAWVAILAAATAALLPGGQRDRLPAGKNDRVPAGQHDRAPAGQHDLVPAGQRDRMMLASIGAGLALFGQITLPADASMTGFLGLFTGSAMLAAAAPDLAIPLLVLVLRLAIRSEWPAAAGALGAGVALIALLTCSAILLRRRRDLPDVLLLAQASIAALAIATLQPDGRFAAVVLLVLLSLTRTAAHAASEPAGLLGLAGLAGIPPLGVFPGLVLAVLAVSNHTPWLLLPMGIGLLPMLRAGLPRRAPVVPWRTAWLSVGWLPLALAALFGFFAPADLVRWLSVLTKGPS